jgi:hypothetical protein|nr:MAG TPA: homing endonuclease [Caudoviricetes sp.]
MEIWKPVLGYENKYEVSNLGNVKSLNYKNMGYIKLLSKYNCEGYDAVKLTKNGVQKRWLVHRIVMFSFFGKKQDLEVNHKNGNKKDNNINNLEYCTRSYNIKHAYDNGLKSALNGKKHPRARQILQLKNGIEVERYDTISEATKKGFESSKIVLCCQGKRKSHKNYQWRYANEKLRT